MVLWSVTLKIGALTKLGLFFPVVCFSGRPDFLKDVYCTRMSLLKLRMAK